MPLLATYPVSQETGLALLDGMLPPFTAAGITSDRAGLAVQSVAVFVLGHALAQVGRPPGTAPEEAAGHGPDAAYYDTWFDTGVSALRKGFEVDLATSGDADR